MVKVNGTQCRTKIAAVNRIDLVTMDIDRAVD